MSSRSLKKPRAKVPKENLDTNVPCLPSESLLVKSTASDLDELDHLEVKQEDISIQQEVPGEEMEYLDINQIIENDEDIDELVDDQPSEAKRPKRKYTKRTLNQAEPGTKRKYTKKKTLKGKKLFDGIIFDPDYVATLAQEFPDRYWLNTPLHDDPKSMIAYIDQKNPLIKLETNIRDRAAITGMALSDDGSMLATFCNGGSTKIWDTVEFNLLQSLEDVKEDNIDEFYVGCFIPGNSHILVGGKRKDRQRWSEFDGDNHVLPCPLKLFDVITGEVESKFDAHQEEILSVKLLEFKGENYIISTSQDGYIWKWKLSEDYLSLMEKTRMQDGQTCMCFTVSFLPHTGNKYFVASCDDKIRIFDFEEAQLLQSFDNIYSYYCDCSKFIQCWDYPQPPVGYDVDEPMFAYLLSRGVEVLDAEENTISTLVSPRFYPHYGQTP